MIQQEKGEKGAPVLIEHEGKRPNVATNVYVAPNAAISRVTTIGSEPAE